MARTSTQKSCPPLTDCHHTHRGELASGNAPTARGAHDLVVVETDRVDTTAVVGGHDEAVDVGTRLRAVSVECYGDIAQPVQRVSGHGVRQLHEFGDRVDALPHPDLAVVQLAVISENGSEQWPIASIDPSRISHQQLRNILPVFAFGHVTSPLGWTTIRGGPAEWRASSSASGTSSRVMTLPTLGNGSN